MEHRIDTRGLPAENIKNATNESNTSSLLCLFIFFRFHASLYHTGLESVVRIAFQPPGDTLDLTRALVHHLGGSGTHEVLADLVVHEDDHLLREIERAREGVNPRARPIGWMVSLEQNSMPASFHR